MKKIKRVILHDVAKVNAFAGLDLPEGGGKPAGAMNFERVIRRVVGGLEAEGIHYALIGGFAMSLRGLQRSTMDLDFILMMQDLAKADRVLRECGYERVFHSENVSHYVSPDRDWGRIDVLHAFRGPTLGMLKRAEILPVLDDMGIKVVHIEDIAGLKVQALVNNPDRATKDWADIRMMLEAAGEQKREIDWELLGDYLSLFQLESKLTELKEWYGKVE